MHMVPATPGIVVGFDGSSAAESAVDWAAAQAKQRRVRLRVVAAMPALHNGTGTGAAMRINPQQLARDLATEGEKRALKMLDGSEITAIAHGDNAVNALVELSDSASLVVVGHPSRSRQGQIFLGSVVYPVATHAKCDVAVVPAGNIALPGSRHAVMVGVDGSEAALNAVDRAAEEAHRWGAPLQIVQTWCLSAVNGPSVPLVGTSILDDDSNFFGQEARKSVARAAAEAKMLHGDLAVATLVFDEHPARALVDTSSKAGLLVVGRRGLGRFEGLLLGSVSRYVIQHATVPVLVVRR